MCQSQLTCRTSVILVSWWDGACRAYIKPFFSSLGKAPSSPSQLTCVGILSGKLVLGFNFPVLIRKTFCQLLPAISWPELEAACQFLKLMTSWILISGERTIPLYLAVVTQKIEHLLLSKNAPVILLLQNFSLGLFIYFLKIDILLFHRSRRSRNELRCLLTCLHRPGGIEKFSTGIEKLKHNGLGIDEYLILVSLFLISPPPPFLHQFEILFHFLNPHENPYTFRCAFFLICQFLYADICKHFLPM